MTKRVCCYIDGFNLYHAIDDLGRNHLKWFNLYRLMEFQLDRHQQHIENVYYFSAIATHLSKDKQKRHRELIKGISHFGVKPILGQFKRKNKHWKDNNTGKVTCLTGHEEKETDVNMALAILNGAHTNEYDMAFIVTGDTDIIPAIRMVKQQFPHKIIKTINPPHRRHPAELIDLSDMKGKITINQLEKSLLPHVIYDAGGNIVARIPTNYKP